MTNPPNPDPSGEQDATPRDPAQPETPETANAAAPESPAAPGDQAPGTPEQPSAPTAPPAPPAPQYQAPQPPSAPQYGAPQQPSAPQQPAAPGYGAPGQPQYGQPNQPQYGQPGQPPYGQPAPPQYAAAAPMGQPGAYQQPVSPAGPYPPPGPGEPFNGAISPDDLTRPLYGATFSQAVKRFFKSFAKFSGRASRSEYWWVALFTFLISLIPLTLYFGGAIILASTSASASSGYSGYDGTMSPATAPANGLGVTFFVLGGILLLIVSLGLLVPNLAITWRRLHDANFAGPFYFIALIPYVGGLVVLVFTILGSNPAGRRFDV